MHVFEIELAQKWYSYNFNDRANLMMKLVLVRENLLVILQQEFIDVPIGVERQLNV